MDKSLQSGMPQLFPEDTFGDSEKISPLDKLRNTTSGLVASQIGVSPDIIPSGSFERISPQDLYALESRLQQDILKIEDRRTKVQVLQYIAQRSVEDAWHLLQASDIPLTTDSFEHIFCHPSVILKNPRFFEHFSHTTHSSLTGVRMDTYLATAKRERKRIYNDTNSNNSNESPNWPVISSRYDALLVDIDIYYQNYLSCRDISREHSTHLQEFGSTRDAFAKKLHSIMFMKGFTGMENHPLAFTQGFYEVYLSKIQDLKNDLIAYFSDKYGDQFIKNDEGRYLTDTHRLPSRLHSLVKTLNVRSHNYTLSEGVSTNPKYMVIHATPKQENVQKTELIVDVANNNAILWALTVTDDERIAIEGETLVLTSAKESSLEEVTVSSLQSPHTPLLKYYLLESHRCLGICGGGTLREDQSAIHLITHEGKLVTFTNPQRRNNPRHFGGMMHATGTHLLHTDAVNPNNYVLYTTEGDVVSNSIPAKIIWEGHPCYLKHMISSSGEIRLYYFTTNGEPIALEQTISLGTGAVYVSRSTIEESAFASYQHLGLVKSIRIPENVDQDLDRNKNLHTITHLHQNYLYTSKENRHSLQVTIYDTKHITTPVRDVELPLDNSYTQYIVRWLSQQQTGKPSSLFPVSDKDGHLSLINMQTGAITQLGKHRVSLDTLEIFTGVDQDGYYTIVYTDVEGKHTTILHRHSLQPYVSKNDICLFDHDDMYHIDVDLGFFSGVSQPSTLSTQHAHDFEKIKILNVLCGTNTEEELKFWGHLEAGYRADRKRWEEENMHHGVPTSMVASLMQAKPALFYNDIASKEVVNERFLTRVITDELSKNRDRSHKSPLESLLNVLAPGFITKRAHTRVRRQFAQLMNWRGSLGIHSRQTGMFDNTIAGNGGANFIENLKNNYNYGSLSRKVDDFLTTSMYGYRSEGVWQKVDFPYHIVTHADVPSCEIHVSLRGGHFRKHYLEKGYNSAIKEGSLTALDNDGNTVAVSAESNDLGEVLVHLPENVATISYTLLYNPSVHEGTPTTHESYEYRKKGFARSSPEAARMTTGAEHLSIPPFFLPFLASIRTDSPNEKIKKIQDFVSMIFYYDDNQPAHLISLKAGMSPDESLSACAYYMEDMKKRTASAQGKFTGVCVDHANLCYALLCASGLVCGIADGPLLCNQNTLGSKNLHRECYVVMPTPDGKHQYILRIPIRINNADISLWGSFFGMFGNAADLLDNPNANEGPAAQDMSQTHEITDGVASSRLVFGERTDHGAQLTSVALSHQADLIINIKELIKTYEATLDEEQKSLIIAAIIQKIQALDEVHREKVLQDSSVALWMRSHMQT